MLRDGGDFAMILWPLLFGMDALLVAVTIAYRPGWMRFVTVLPGVR